MDAGVNILSKQHTLEQVERITSSRPFDRLQARPKDALRWLVAKTLLGETEQIKEMTLALAVFDESADSFNPTENSKIRQAIGDLRQRLAIYAKREGSRDAIEILIPLNRYIPDIQDRRVAVLITEFENWHPLGHHRHLCAAMVAEIGHQLCQAGLRAGSIDSFQRGVSRRQLTLRGSVEGLKVGLRINISLADPAAGEILCAKSFEGPREDVLRLATSATTALLDAIPPAAAPIGARSRRSS